MKNTVFTTRLRAEEIIKEAISVWKQSFQSEKLEGIADDPVFSLFITALAYQANEMDVEIEGLREEILQEFAQMIVPFENLHALPATVVAEGQLDDHISEQVLNQNTSFILRNTSYSFLPLLKTRLINCKVSSVVREDKRRWKVMLEFKEPTNNLQGMTFMVCNPHFQDLKLYQNGHVVPLVKPWEYVDLPLSECFSIDNMLYNKASVYEGTSTWFDLFAKQNVRLFCIDNYRSSTYLQGPTTKMEFIFEFFGINDKFFLDKDQLKLNSVVLTNVRKSAVTLSPSAPLAQISLEGSQQFLHMIKPAEIQIMKDEPITVRKTATDRFNSKRLLDLITTFMYRYRSDYYAFQQFPALRDGKFLERFDVFMKKLSESLDEYADEKTAHIYVSLNNRFSSLERESLDVEYLTTDGAAVNSSLSSQSEFNADAYGIQSLKVVAEPMPGFDEPKGLDAENSVASYYMITSDRIVTPADIKVLCYNVLQTRYSIGKDMVDAVKVKNLRNTDRSQCGFVTMVYITLKNDLYIQKRLEDLISSVELTLQKMIEVRSTNVFPVQVSVELI